MRSVLVGSCCPFVVKGERSTAHPITEVFKVGSALLLLGVSTPQALSLSQRYASSELSISVVKHYVILIERRTGMCGYDITVGVYWVFLKETEGISLGSGKGG